MHNHTSQWSIQILIIYITTCMEHLDFFPREYATYFCPWAYLMKVIPETRRVH
jgi:hypothetical protein